MKTAPRRKRKASEVAPLFLSRGFLVVTASLGTLSLYESYKSLFQTVVEADLRQLLAEKLQMPLQPEETNHAANEFGACIMFKDDLHLLPEWIAYHYTILPLRYLVVGVDEGNTQDPLPYLSQWEDLGLQFQIISVLDDFLTSGLHRNNYDTSTFDGAHQLLKAKQRVFIQSCTKILRSWGVHWTSYVDIDEFLTYDNGYGENNSSMARLLQDWQAEGFLQSPCYTIPRLRYGSQESANCSLSITLDGEESLTTRRFVQHARKGDFSASKFGKVLVNVSALSNETVDAMPRVVHRPFVPDCGPAGLVVNDLTRVLANHYTGGMDSFLSRADDARRSEEAWKEFARHDASHSCDNPTMSSWIERLVRQVGSAAKARELLKLDSMLQRKSV